MTDKSSLVVTNELYKVFKTLPTIHVEKIHSVTWSSMLLSVVSEGVEQKSLTRAKHREMFGLVTNNIHEKIALF